MHYYPNVPYHHVPHHPVSYAHVPHCPCALLPMFPITLPHVDLEGGHATLPICPITPVPMSDGAAKCQVVKNMSIVKKSNTWTMESSQKIN